MRHARVLALAACLGIALPAMAVDVYKWKDANGVVHYGDRPAAGAAARVLSLPDDDLSAEEQDAADERLALARQKISAANDGGAGVTAPWPRHRPVVASTCAQSWQRYDASQACFDNHRLAGGRGVSDEGIAVCRQMPQPTCPR